MTENSALAMQREALINELRNVDDIDVIQKVQRSLNHALAAVKKAASKAQEEKDKEEYISKEEIMDSLRESLTEYYSAKKEGRKLKSAGNCSMNYRIDTTIRFDKELKRLSKSISLSNKMYPRIPLNHTKLQIFF